MNLKHYWIIDDDPIARMLIEKKMQREKLGPAMKCFTNGQDALEFLISMPNERPDLIFLDLNMPIMDGWGFLEEGQLKISASPTKVVILTSSISEDDRTKALGFKCVSCFLKKPLDTEELKSYLKN